MRTILRGIVTLAVAAAFAACSSGSNTSTTAPGTGGGGGAAACSESTDTATVKAGISGFAFNPSTINAKVGDVISWSNDDSAGHGVALDDGSCKMSGTISQGSSKSLKFTVAGTYPFHCFVHSNMKGTIVVS